tara:strand:- start:323 stop:772 length:450 start_codon:yes stop_codon:yes gene_type:complete
MLNENSIHLMNRVIKLSEDNLNNNKVPIAAIVVDSSTNKIISEATNGDSVLDHAEILALKKALDKLSTNRLNECDIYVTIEPCPMCATAIAKTHIRRLYFGAEDKKGGGVINGPKIFSHSNLKVPEVISHCFAEETGNLLKKFFESKRN